MPFRPGLNDHCIGVNPYYLTYKSEQLGYHPQLVLAGRRINDNMSKVIVDKLIFEMPSQGMVISGAYSCIRYYFPRKLSYLALLGLLMWLKLCNVMALSY